MMTLDSNYTVIELLPGSFKKTGKKGEDWTVDGCYLEFTQYAITVICTTQEFSILDTYNT